MIYRPKRGLVLLSLISSLVACGGGGDDSPAPASTSPEGVFGGKLTGSTSTDFQMIVLENGELWSLYGINSGSMFGLNGFAQGTVSTNGSTFNSANMRDYGFAPALAGTANGTFNQSAGTISGSVSANGQSVSFSGGPIAGSLYNYNTPATLANVSGTWTLNTLSSETIFLTVQSNGSLSATTSLGCSFIGSVTPRPSGKNVFDATVTFGPAPCALPNQTGTGIALAYPTSSSQTQLLVALQDLSRTYGAAAFGVR